VVRFSPLKTDFYKYFREIRSRIYEPSTIKGSQKWRNKEAGKIITSSEFKKFEEPENFSNFQLI